jgi:Tfp pilus assembly protein PilF
MSDAARKTDKRKATWYEDFIVQGIGYVLAFGLVFGFLWFGFPDYFKTRHNVYATLLVSEGQSALERKDLDRAIERFTGAVQIEPKYAEAYYLRGVAYGEKGDAVRALADQQEAIRLKPALAKSRPK